jgi:hypothetical protein
MFSRRDMLAATAVGGAVTAATMTTANATPVKSDIGFGNPNDPPQGAINAKNPRSISDPGPQNPAIRDQFPGAFSPPATDVGSMPLSWASFNNAPRCIQNGGWARQVTQDSFAVADTISGVNMRDAAHGRRADAVECRVGTWDGAVGSTIPQADCVARVRHQRRPIQFIQMQGGLSNLVEREVVGASAVLFIVWPQYSADRGTIACFAVGLWVDGPEQK